MLKDDFPSQQRWPLAKVIQVFTGDDDLVRTVDILCKGKTYRRAIMLIITADQPFPPSMSGSNKTEV